MNGIEKNSEMRMGCCMLVSHCNLFGLLVKVFATQGPLNLF